MNEENMRKIMSFISIMCFALCFTNCKEKNQFKEVISEKNKGITKAKFSKDKEDSNYIQKNFEPCRIAISDTLSLYKIKENLYSNDIDIIVKSENVITAECPGEKISEELLNALKISENPLIKINKNAIEGLTITDFKNLIPYKIVAVKKINYSIIIVELYSFSYSTVGDAYIDLCFKIDDKGKVLNKKMLESESSLEMSTAIKIF